MPITNIRQHVDPRRLSINITSNTGRVFRWGYDEKDASNIPSGITITTQMPGGFATMDCNLTRRPDLTYYDLDRFAPCTVYGPGAGLVAFDGYLSSRPLNRGSAYTFSPEAIGWSGEMKDDTSFSMVYIDRVLSKWVGMSTQRVIDLTGAGVYDINSFSGTATVDPTQGNPGLMMSGTGPWTREIVADLYYDAGAGNIISSIGGTLVTLPNGYGSGDTNADFAVYTGVSDHGPFTQIINVHSSSSAQAFSASAGASANRWLLFEHVYVVAAGANGPLYGGIWENPFVMGNHGLTLHTGPSGTTALQAFDSGFLGGDIIADVISRTCPHLTVTRGSTGVVNDNFVVCQAAFNQPGDADTAVQQINQYYLNDYGVYENRNFFWRPAGSGTEWHVRVSDGVQVQDQGPQIETAFNGVVVQYSDPDGTTRYVGPPGKVWDRDPATGATSSALLQDTSTTNIVNQYGRKRWALVQMGTTTWQGALAVGQIFLSTTASRPSAGTATVVGFAVTKSGAEYPAYMIRAGDTLVIDDTSDNSTHYILNTSYSHDSLSNTLTLDAAPNQLDWILQRLSLAISPLG